MTELGWRLGQVTLIGVRQYRAQKPPRIILSFVLPRVLMQTLYFSLIGRILSGSAGLSFAFVGAVGMAMVSGAGIDMCDVTSLDKTSRTFSALRLGRIEPFTVLLCRAVPNLLEGFGAALAALLIAGPILGLWHVSAHLLMLLPVIAVMTLSVATAGLFTGSLALGRSADVLYGNLLAFVILLGAGVLAPASRLGPLSVLGSVLPLRHGLDALRRSLAGRPWGGQLLLEAAVAVGWLLAAWLLFRWQVGRASRHGYDAFD